MKNNYKTTCVWHKEALYLLMATKPTAQFEDCLTCAYTFEGFQA